MKYQTLSPRRSACLAAFTKFMRAYNAFSAAQARTLHFPVELQGSGFPILEVLFHKGPLSQREIAGKILRTGGNISQAIDKLERAGLVVRTPGADRRIHLVQLTEQGERLISEWFPVVAENIEDLFLSLSDEELELWGKLSKKLGTSIQ